jgi:hypothetical protein
LSQAQTNGTNLPLTGISEIAKINLSSRKLICSGICHRDKNLTDISVKDFVSLDHRAFFFFFFPVGSTLFWSFEEKRVKFGSHFIKHHLIEKERLKSEITSENV